MNPLLIYLSIPCLFIYPHYPQAELTRCIIDTSYGRGESISSIIIHSFILPKGKNFAAPVCQDFCERSVSSQGCHQGSRPKDSGLSILVGLCLTAAGERLCDENQLLKY